MFPPAPAGRRLSARALALAVMSLTASAFRPSSPLPTKPTSPTNQQQRRRASAVALLAYFRPPPPPMWGDPFFPPPAYGPPPGYDRYGPPPRRSVILDAEAEVMDEADELLEEQREEERWRTDRKRAEEEKERTARRSGPRGRGEVIDSDLESLRSAAAYPSEVVEDKAFQGRRPGQAVNGANERREVRRRGPEDAGEFNEPGIGKDMRDPREQHVIIDDYDEYANEEEDLINSMGGRGRTTTQEFAGLGTMMKKNGRAGGRYDSAMPTDPQQRNYNPEQQDFLPLPPPPGYAPGPGFREEGYLGDSTLREISHDYSVPIPYLADVLANWGAPVPIDPTARLGDVVTGEQAFAVLEAIHTLDVAALHERYSEDNLMSICDYYGIDMKEAFEFCVERGWALPFGVRTFLRVEQEEELLDALGGDLY